MTTEREKLIEAIVSGWRKQRLDDEGLNVIPIVDAILAAGFRLVTPASEGEAGDDLGRLVAAACAAPSINSFPTQSVHLPPGKDVVDGARAVVDAWESDIIAQPADLAEAIARFASEREARVREECAKIVDAAACDWDIARSGPKSIAAAIRAGGSK